MAPVDDPSFIALTEGELHATSETTAGRLVSFTVSAGELRLASVAASGGTAPCHVVLDPASGALVVTNYTGGTFAALSADALDPARVARVLPLPAGHGPVADRQEAPHAHSSTPTPWGTMLVSDLGTDRLYEVKVDPVTLEPSFVKAHAMPAGSGPRHFAWLGQRLLVAGELDGHVHVLDHVDDGFMNTQSVAAYDPAQALGTGEVLVSHIAVHDGRVYVAVRGRDSIAVLAPSTADVGLLELVGEVPCGGRWPRHFAIAPDPRWRARPRALRGQPARSHRHDPAPGPDVGLARQGPRHDPHRLPLVCGLPLATPSRLQNTPLIFYLGCIYWSRAAKCRAIRATRAAGFR